MREASGRVVVRRTAVAVLSCLLAATLAVAVQRAQGHPHPLRGNAVTIASSADSPHVTPRIDHGDVAVRRPSVSVGDAAGDAVADPHHILATFTADSLPARGPPGEARA